ncbi:MAG: MFS transporter [Bdellovibrionales bacterium]|nr:MFS transporter [Bdellovibrionales bacterium]
MIFGRSVRSTEQSLKLSNLDAFLYSLMVGAGESYLPAYSLSIGMGEAFAGILASLPLVSGALLQLVTPRLLHKVHSHKYWVVLSTALQATAFLPLIYFSATRAPNFWIMFFILTLYWGAGFSAGSAWNFWMGQLVPENRSSKFFSVRNRIQQFGILFGIVGGGVALHNKVSLGPFTSVFTMLFVFAFICRLTSSLVLSRKMYQSEWVLKDQVHRLRDSWKVFWSGKHKKRFFAYLVPYQIAVYVSSPFVTPYMLAQMKMNYGQYMGAIAALMVGKIISLSIMQSLKGNFDGFKVMIAGLLLVSPLPALWAVSESYYYVVALQIMSGMGWACFENGLSLVFFKDLRQDEKVPVITIYNLLNSLAIIIGTFFGARVLSAFGAEKTVYWSLFAGGALLRVIFCIPVVKQSRNWKKISDQEHEAVLKAS